MTRSEEGIVPHAAVAGVVTAAGSSRQQDESGLLLRVDLSDFSNSSSQEQ